MKILQVYIEQAIGSIFCDSIQIDLLLLDLFMIQSDLKKVKDRNS